MSNIKSVLYVVVIKAAGIKNVQYTCRLNWIYEHTVYSSQLRGIWKLEPFFEHWEGVFFFRFVRRACVYSIRTKSRHARVLVVDHSVFEWLARSNYSNPRWVHEHKFTPSLSTTIANRKCRQSSQPLMKLLRRHQCTLTSRTSRLVMPAERYRIRLFITVIN